MPIFAPPPLRNPSTNFNVMSNILLRPPQGVDVQNLVEIYSAVTDLRMREKTRFVWIFFINISIRPFLRLGYRSQFWGEFYT